MLTKPAHTFSPCRRSSWRRPPGASRTSSTPTSSSTSASSAACSRSPSGSRRSSATTCTWTLRSARCAGTTRAWSRSPTAGSRSVPGRRSWPYRRPSTRGSPTSRPCPSSAPAPTSTFDGLRHQGARRVRPAVLAGCGTLRHRVQPYELVHEAYDNSMYGSEQGTSSGSSRTSTRTTCSRCLRGAQGPRARLARHYYGDEARRPVVYYESDWGTEEWTPRRLRRELRPRRSRPVRRRPRAAVGPLRFASSDLAGHGYQHVGRGGADRPRGGGRDPRGPAAAGGAVDGTDDGPGGAVPARTAPPVRHLVTLDGCTLVRRVPSRP